MEKFFIIYIILINIVGILSMYIDKIRSISHKWRISEKTLIFIALLGGGIGSLLGMKRFRHKTKHLKFSLGIPLIVAIEVIITIYYFVYKV